MTSTSTSTRDDDRLDWATGLMLAIAPTVGIGLTLAECYAKSAPIQLVWNAFIDVTAFDRRLVGGIVHATAILGLIVWLFVAPFAAVRLWQRRRQPVVAGPARRADRLLRPHVHGRAHRGHPCRRRLEAADDVDDVRLRSRSTVGALLLVSLTAARRLLRPARASTAVPKMLAPPPVEQTARLPLPLR
ncbi:MAG: hypothetical protein R3D67_21175 [Hyphomicrobiaceae bacterium]